MAASVKVTFDVSKATKRLKETLRTVKEGRRFLGETADFLEERVKFETRRGKPYNKERIFPELTEFTKLYREMIEKTMPGKLHRSYRRRKSHVTLTGDLVDGINASVKSKKIRIAVGGSRTTDLKLPTASQVRGVFGSGPKGKQMQAIRAFLSRLSGNKTTSNKEVARQLSARGFDLFDSGVLSRDKKIEKRVLVIFRRFLRRALKVRSKL